ncbi:hypothetical protein QQZ08_008054 [Neonectria magnoliae]|uniref:Myb-like domain-containing protein n=1 Tax=Neonectria magnoliae TaxID=2732573 RepID=A0ABR1HX27_9HYPO
MPHNADAAAQDSSRDASPTLSEMETSEQPEESAEESNEAESTSEDRSGNESSEAVSDEKSAGDDSDVSSTSVCEKGEGHEECLKDRCLKAGDHAQSSSEPDSTQPSANSGQTESSTDTQSEKPAGKSKKNKKKAKSSDSGSATQTVSTTDVSSNDASTTDNKTSSQPESSADNASTNLAPSVEDSSKASMSNGNTTTSKQSTAPDDPAWSISQDCLLRGMKEDGATWADIGGALNKGKKEAKARWQVIKDQLPFLSRDDPEPASGTDQAAGEVSPIEENEGKKDNESSQSQEKAPTSPVVCVQEKKGNKPKPKGKQNSSNYNTRWHKGKRNDKVAAENKQAKAKAKATKAQRQTRQTLSGEESSSESSASSSSASAASLSQPGYDDPEKNHEMRYLQDHIYADLYPAVIRPEPDAYLGKRDCDLLAAIDSKQKQSRWLEMQANFFNVTGRMVSLDAIRARCERAEEVERAKTRRRNDFELVDRLEKVERWVSKVSHEDFEDPGTQ